MADEVHPVLVVVLPADVPDVGRSELLSLADLAFPDFVSFMFGVVY